MAYALPVHVQWNINMGVTCWLAGTCSYIMRYKMAMGMIVAGSLSFIVAVIVFVSDCNMRAGIPCIGLHLAAYTEVCVAVSAMRMHKASCIYTCRCWHVHTMCFMRMLYMCLQYWRHARAPGHQQCSCSSAAVGNPGQLHGQASQHSILCTGGYGASRTYCICST